MRYSLANYYVSFTHTATDLTDLFDSVSIGGEYDTLSSIDIAYASNLWTTTGYATGAWVHAMNLDRHGTITITLSIISDNIDKFIKFCNLFYLNGAAYEGLTMTVTNTVSDVVLTATDCYIQKIPNLQLSATPGNQQWVFTCGKIDFNENFTVI